MDLIGAVSLAGRFQAGSAIMAGLVGGLAFLLSGSMIAHLAFGVVTGALYAAIVL
jgi:hypothetical protein